MIEQPSGHKLAGTTIAHYHLDHLIDAHPWGPVFLAYDKTNATRPCILRFIGEPQLTSLHQKKQKQMQSKQLILLGRFQQEANKLAILRHPSLLPVLDYGFFLEHLYLVYPIHSLVSLHSLLQRHSPTDIYTIRHYLEQIVYALTYAHEQAVLHRNLSTQCIYLYQNRHIIISETGLLRLVELLPKDEDLTIQEEIHQGIKRQQQEFFRGSIEASAPEQLLGKPIDTYTDMYGLGAVLYHLLTGHAPFEGPTRADVARQHLYAVIPPLSTWRTDLPTELDEVFTRALAKDPLQRYACPADLLQAYRQAIGDHGPFTTGTGSFQTIEPIDVQDAQKRSHIDSLSSKPPAIFNNEQKLPQITDKLASIIAPSMQELPVEERSTRRPWALSRRRLFALAGVGSTVAVAAIASPEILPNLIPQNQIRHSNTAGIPVQTTALKSPSTVLAHTKDLQKNSAQPFILAQRTNNGLLIHLADDRFVAYDATCTHAGCPVDYNTQTQQLECHCHGAVFDPAHGATVLQGPATQPLPAIAITVQADGTIVAK